MNSDAHPATQPTTPPSSTDVAAVERMVFGKNRLLWIGVTAVMVPLAVLLGLQYRWLIELQRHSTVARQATLENYLGAIANDVGYFFTSTADRILTLPPNAYDEATIQQAAQFFGTRKLDGVSRVFVVTYQPIPKLFFYDEATRSMVEQSTPSADSRAVWVASSPWSTLHKTLGEIVSTDLAVNGHDPERRIILNPVTDENHFLIAITGLIVDQSYFIENVLPHSIGKSLPKFDDPEALWVCVHDNRGRCVYPEQPCAPIEPDRVERTLDFVFPDWTLSLQGTLAVPEHWARANFVINVTLSAALAVVLLGGIAFTVRTAMREMKLSAMKNEFVSNVSHELRTPLASIRVFGELMRHGRVREPSKVAEYGLHIETESRRLSQLINNILDFSHIESGQKIYSFQPADLEKVVRNTLDAYEVRIRDQGFDLEYIGPGRPLPALQMDTGAMDRAVANLLDNAIKYSNGGGKITVRLEKGANEVTLSVADQGIGIPAEEHDRVFERFHRVSTGLVHDVKGTGLGLSLVQHIVNAHGGTVSLESELGEGSTFTIHLPVDWQPNHIGRGQHGSGLDR
jgi:signal transduction histidine kinase